MAAVVAPLVGGTVRGRVAAVSAAGVSAVAVVALLWIVVRTDHVFPSLFEPDRIAQGFAYVVHPRETAAGLAAATDAALSADKLAPAARARIGADTADALPVETALVEANGLRWTPLPIFQAYSAYTAALDDINRDAIVRAGARYVLYRYEAIDLRLPFGEMPAATVELLCRYRLSAEHVPTAGSGEFMLLERSPGAACGATPAGTAPAPQMGRPIAVPRAPRGTFITASFALRPTLLTRAEALLWRAPVVFYDITYENGSVDRRRAVTGTVGDGVVVSAAPRNAGEAARFWAGGEIAAVRSVTLVAHGGAYVLDGVTFTRLERTRNGAPAP
jgi:hypothetical protein